MCSCALPSISPSVLRAESFFIRRVRCRKLNPLASHMAQIKYDVAAMARTRNNKAFPE
jgi:hypothetical protein